MTDRFARSDIYCSTGITSSLWSCIETDIWTFKPLVAIEVKSMEKNHGMFSSKTFFSTKERKTWASWMTWGWVNYQEIFIWMWT